MITFCGRRLLRLIIVPGCSIGRVAALLPYSHPFANAAAIIGYETLYEVTSSEDGITCVAMENARAITLILRCFTNEQGL